MRNIPDDSELARLEKITKYLVASGYYLVASGKDSNNKTIMKPIPFEQAMAKVLRGWALGLDPSASLEGVVIVQGKMTLSSDLTGALMQSHGYDWKFLEQSDKKVSGLVYKNGNLLTETPFEYTFADAEKAGHTSGMNSGNWKKFPGAMLIARWKTGVARALAPRVFIGSVYTPDELGVATDEDGNVVEMVSEIHPNVTPIIPAVAIEDTKRTPTSIRVSTIRDLLPKGKDRLPILLKSVEYAAKDLQVEVPTLDTTSGPTITSSLESLDGEFLDVVIESLERRNIIVEINEQLASIADTQEDKNIQLATAAKRVDAALGDRLLTLEDVEGVLYYELDMDTLHALQSAVVLMVSEYADSQPKAQPSATGEPLSAKIKAHRAKGEKVNE